MASLNRLNNRSKFEVVLILSGICVYFFTLHFVVGSDGQTRFDTLSQLLTKGSISAERYSMIGTILSAPLWWLGSQFGAPETWCARYNFLVFVAGLAVIYWMLREHLSRKLLNTFILLLIAGSMFPGHIFQYFGEPFTAMAVGAGILAVSFGRPKLGWIMIVLGVANTPVFLVGLVGLVLFYAFERKRLRYLIVLPITAGLIAGECWIRRGNPFSFGYDGDAGLPTVMPYSGLAGFSYPFFFGVISILFSFGKGIFYFAPGLVLSPKEKLLSLSAELWLAYRLWICVLAGAIIAYSKWWSWYGGFFWGPRFFLIASIPAAFALALYITTPAKSIIANACTLLVLCLSVWVSICGPVFGQYYMEICYQNNYALEHLCWYVPEYSVLWYPFVTAQPIDPSGIAIIFYHLIVFVYLAAPLLLELFRQLGAKYVELRKDIMQMRI